MVQLFVIFAVILFLLKMKRPLYMAMTLGIISAIVLYGISWNKAWDLIGYGIFQKDTMELLLAFYGINLLQKAMEIQNHQKESSDKIATIFLSNRKNIMVMPFLMGLLPNAGAILLAAPVIESLSGSSLSKEEKAFVTSYYRHISESFLPTYSYIILAVKLSGIDMGRFQIAMLPVVFVLFYLGYLFYVRKVPNQKQYGKISDTKMHLMQFLKQYWAIILLVITILLGNVPVHIAIYPVVALFLVINRFQKKELKEIITSAVQMPMMLDTVVVMVFKEILLFSSVLDKILNLFMTFQIPLVIVFGLLFFIGSLIAGSQAIIALGIPLAFASIPNGGVGLLILAIGAAFSASQMSPTHVCLSIVTEYFYCSFWELVKKTLPLAAIFMAFITIYSSFLSFIF